MPTIAPFPHATATGGRKDPSFTPYVHIALGVDGETA